MPMIAKLLPAQRQVWTSPDSFATTLLTLFIDTYGTEGTTWSPETVLLQVEEDFQIPLPQTNYDRLLAGINLLTTDSFYQSLPDFITWCNILAGDSYNPELWDPADAGEIAWGITEAMLLAPPDEDEPFADDIRAYIGAVLDQEGIIDPPDVLRLAIRDRNPSMNLPDAYSDDPTMFAAIYGTQADRGQALTDLLIDGLRRLTQQLDTLPLREGDTKNVVKRMLQATKV